MKQNKKQKLFVDFVLGVLVYAVVLGFFEDYTDILNTWSYSVTFFVAIVLQILTQITLWLKSIVVKSSRNKRTLIFFVWLIMFLSKFVFLAVIDFIFGGLVAISGFVGLIMIIAVMAIFKKLIEVVYANLN